MAKAMMRVMVVIEERIWRSLTSDVVGLATMSCPEDNANCFRLGVFIEGVLSRRHPLYVMGRHPSVVLTRRVHQR